MHTHTISICIHQNRYIASLYIPCYVFILAGKPWALVFRHSRIPLLGRRPWCCRLARWVPFFVAFSMVPRRWWSLMGKMMINQWVYHLVIQHSHGKWPIYRWFTYWKLWFSMAMLNNQMVPREMMYQWYLRGNFSGFTIVKWCQMPKKHGKWWLPGHEDTIFSSNGE